MPSWYSAKPCVVSQAQPTKSLFRGPYTYNIISKYKITLFRLISDLLDFDILAKLGRFHTHVRFEFLFSFFPIPWG